MGYGEATGVSSEYANHRLISMKKISEAMYTRDVIEGERIQIPEQGYYTFMFSVGDDYAWIANKDNDSLGRGIMPDDLQDWVGQTPAKVLKYPKYYRAPYKRVASIQSGLREIDILGTADSNIVYWHDTHPADGHGRSAASTYPYNRYGADDAAIYRSNAGGVQGSLSVQAGAQKNAWYLDRFYPFDQAGGVQVPDEWLVDDGQGHMVYDLSKMFTTGYTGHHVCKISVEPGRTYYLTTRVTNKGFPDVDSIDPSDPDNPSKAIFNADGTIKKIKYYQIFTYAVVAKRTDAYGRGYYEALSYETASNSDITTDLFMKEIKIPDATFPERYVPETEDDWANKHHMELWFTCDQCYINGCANLDPSDTDPVGYVPRLYLMDKDVSDNNASTKTDYQDKVTVAPLQRPKTQSNYDGKAPEYDDPEYTDNFGFPYEYIINREMYEKYGPIVKRSEYSNATTPEKLMEYANIEMLSMTEEPSFEVSAADLKACGISECDTFRLLQKIKIDTEPHGINKNVSLSKMSLNLADLGANTYSFGYEPTSDLSAMQNGGES